MIAIDDDMPPDENQPDTDVPLKMENPSLLSVNQLLDLVYLAIH